MLARHPTEELTHHDRTLAQLVHERNAYLTENTALDGNMMMNLSEEEGHVFDHEPGMTDYHHGIERLPEDVAH